MTMRNENYVTVDADFVEKRYSSGDRYQAEMENIRIFKEAGFRVSEIISSDSAKRIHRMRVCWGVVRDELSTDDIKRCAIILKQVYSAFSQRCDRDATARAYLKGVKGAILQFIAEHSLHVHEVVLDRHLAVLFNNFKVTLFKDAKPSNWVIDSEFVTMIDFDYVTPSFYLADLSQLLNYSVQLTDKQKMMVVQKYTEDENLDRNVLRVLYLLSSSYSCLMALKYGPERDAALRERFKSLVIKHLAELGVTYA